MIGKSTLPKWQYDFNCANCMNIKEIHEPEKHREGRYCVKIIEIVDSGKPENIIHADDDRHVRCNCYSPKGDCV